MTTAYLGIDVSKATLQCTLVDAASRQPTWEQTMPNTPDGVAQLLAFVPPDSCWVLEPTGRYSTPVAAAARAAGRDVRLACPRKAKAFLRAIQDRAKTDRLDSRGLALFGISVALPPYPQKGETLEHLDQLLAARRGIAQSLSRLRQQAEALPRAAGPLHAAAAALQAQQADLDRQIATASTTAALPGVTALDAVPGIGPVTAAAVAARLAAKQFSHPDQFVAYIGLDLRVDDSGAHRGRRRLSKRGDAELRRLLYLAAQATLRCRAENPFQQQYARERAKGLSTTAALNAVARKLARLCWSLVKHGTTYDPARVHHQPKGAPTP